MSLENRASIRPAGVTSKKSNGAPNIPCNNVLWSMIAACKQAKCGNNSAAIAPIAGKRWDWLHERIWMPMSMDLVHCAQYTSNDCLEKNYFWKIWLINTSIVDQNKLQLILIEYCSRLNIKLAERKYLYKSELKLKELQKVRSIWSFKIKSSL